MPRAEGRCLPARLGELEGVLADGDLTFLHRLEQSTLDLCRSTVNLICQDEVGKDGTLLHDEFLVLLTVNHRTNHVCRQQVGCKLNAAELGVNQLSQCLDGHRLGQTRHTFQEDMPVAEQADKQGLYQVLLSYDDLIHACHEIGDEATLSLYAFV